MEPDGDHRVTSLLSTPQHDQSTTLRELVFGQLGDLLDALGLRESRTAALDLLGIFLGDTGDRGVGEGPAWPSDVADDHSPVEWSVAFDENRLPTVRILVEPLATRPGNEANARTGLRMLGGLRGHSGLSTSRLWSLGDLFFPDDPHGLFSLWYSLVLRPGKPMEIKAYLNPAAGGAGEAIAVVTESLRRLGFGAALPMLAEHGLARGPELDSCSYFALDLNDDAHARVKVYLTHRSAAVEEVVHAARAVPGLDLSQLREFCRLAGDPGGRFARRPLMSSYSFIDASVERPSGFSVYIPIREYVADDGEARDRALSVLKHFGMDVTACDDAIAAVSRRPLAAGRGLIAHLSLRMGVPRPGVSVYLSTELYGIKPVLHKETGALAGYGRTG
jgi:DMATS type aromatic prenyltransferase